ncbi:MAG: hypothetical protein ACI4E1_01910 [Lachnospira sp.]
MSNDRNNLSVRIGVLNNRLAEDRARKAMQMLKKSEPGLKVYKTGIDISLNSDAEECMGRIIRSFADDKIDMAVVELKDLNNWYLKYGRPDGIMVGATFKRRDNKIVMLKSQTHKKHSSNVCVYATSELIAEQFEQLYESVHCYVKDNVSFCLRELKSGETDAVVMYSEELKAIPRNRLVGIKVYEFEVKRLIPESLSGVSVLLIKKNPYLKELAQNITDKTTEICMAVEGAILFNVSNQREDVTVTAYTSVKRDRIITCAYAYSERYAYRLSSESEIKNWNTHVSKVVDRIKENV